MSIFTWRRINNISLEATWRGLSFLVSISGATWRTVSTFLLCRISHYSGSVGGHCGTNWREIIIDSRLDHSRRAQSGGTSQGPVDSAGTKVSAGGLQFSGRSGYPRFSGLHSCVASLGRKFCGGSGLHFAP